MDLEKHTDRVIFTARISTVFIVLGFESVGIFIFFKLNSFPQKSFMKVESF